MNIAELFIRRPITTTLVMAGILVFGLMGYRSLSVSDLPTVDFPTIVVSANLPGASPETMASAVATPLEKQFSAIPGLDSMSSNSSQGRTLITLQFNLKRNIDGAAQDVQAMIARTLRDLPPNMPSPPSYRKVNPANASILLIALSSPTLPLSKVDEYAENILAQRISMVSGVAQVDVSGSQKYAVRIQLDPRALATRQIGIDEISTAVQRGNVNIPMGSLSGLYQSFTLQAANSQLRDAADFRSLIVTYRNGSPVRLQDLGKVIDDVEDNKQAGWYNNTRAIILGVDRQPGANVVEVVDAVKKLLPSLSAQLPPSIKLEILFDRTQSIRESVHDVQFTLVLTVALVVMVIFLFIRNLSATVIPSLALPVSIIGTFAVMYLLGYSMNNLSLMALTLSVGFVVDDAIVVLENIVRHMEMGKKPFQAALEGSKEIGFTIVSMTLSLAAVFIPVLFMGGILGRLLKEFAVTICVAILVSGFVSLSLTPMLCSRFLRPPREKKHGRLYAVSERFFDGMLHAYEESLKWVLDHRLATLLGSGVLLVATAYLFVAVPKGFIPSEDTGQIIGSTEAAQGISFEDMARHQKAVAAIIAEDPNVEGFMSSVGGGGGGAASNGGRLFIRLKPRSERALSSDQIIQQLRSKLAQIPGIRVSLQNPPSIRIGGRIASGLYQFTLQSPDAQELYRYAPVLEEKLRGLAELQDVRGDLQLKNPELEVVINRDKAATMGITAQGLTAQQIQDTFQTAYGSRRVSTINTTNDQYQVIMELEPKFQSDPSALSMLYIRPAGGQSSSMLIPLTAIADLKQGVGPMSVSHTGQLPSVTLSFNLKPGVALGDGVAAVNRLAAETLPGTITTSFQGAAREFEASLQGLWLLLLMAILVVYLVLGILYESFVHPLTILSGLPSAGLGALLTLLLFGTDLNIYAFVGIIMLVGIVKKNAIMQIDFAIEGQRKEGKSPLQAIYDGCIIRFRPHYDDHDGGAHGKPADRAGLWRRLRSASPPGSGSRRRSPGLAAAHPLYHSGDLSLPGIASGGGP